MTVISRLEAVGVECYTRKEWGSIQERNGSYEKRKRTHPMPAGPAPYHYLHITVTKDTDTVREGAAGARQIETYGYSTPPMVSYQDLVTNEGRYFEGQNYRVKGTHTVNDKNVKGFPRDLNLYGYATALMQNVQDGVTDIQVKVVAAIFAARELEGLVKKGAPVYPHRKFAYKSCPGDKAVDRLPEIIALKNKWVNEGKIPRIGKLPPTAPPTHKSINVFVGHASLQFSDTPAQWKHDCEVIFKIGYHWMTGTEAGETDNWKILQAAATKNGYVVRRYKSNWVAVKRSIVKTGTFKIGVKTVIDNDLVAGPGHDTNYIWAEFVHKTPRVGKISVLGSHYPTKGKPEAKDPAYRVNLKWTRKIGTAVGRKMAVLGKGTALAFYGGDQNISDKLSDTFFGQPVTTCWDELKKWPNTGHGPIDVIASLDADARVRCIGARAFNDKSRFLYSDHFLIQARYEIRLL